MFEGVISNTLGILEVIWFQKAFLANLSVRKEVICDPLLWFLRYWSMWRTEFFVILDRFFPFYTPNNLKNQNFEKMKKTHRNIIILLKCTQNHDHMLYCSLDMVLNRFNYFLFWAIFYPFTHLTAWKIKI